MNPHTRGRTPSRGQWLLVPASSGRDCRGFNGDVESSHRRRNGKHGENGAYPMFDLLNLGKLLPDNAAEDLSARSLCPVTSAAAGV